MRAVSLFSGAGGIDLAFDRAGIETVLQCEIDPWAQRVLRRHWPDTERIADVRDVGCRRASSGRDGSTHTGSGSRLWALHPVDLVYGGFPCQPFSVAGKRAGDRDDRNLWPEFRRVVRELRPRWVVAENVPGLLSFDNGRFFGGILTDLADLGFDGVAYAILDAQHFGVPQRRRRVFIVAGPTRRAVEQVLSLCESCGGNPPPRRTPGQDVAGSAGDGTTDVSAFHWQANTDDIKLAAIPGSLSTNRVQAVLASAVSASAGHHGHSSPRGDGADNLVMEDRMPEKHITQQCRAGDHDDADGDEGFWECECECHAEPPTRVAPDIAFSLDAQSGRVSNREGRTTLIADTVSAKWAKGADVQMGAAGNGNLVMGTLDTHLGDKQWLGDQDVENFGLMDNIGAGVRRLTPLECERLQGWPDDWTRWADDGSEVPDSQRYKLVGNGVASPCAEWIGRRLVAVDARLAGETEAR